MSYVEEIDRLTAEVAKAERERDEARAVVARVRALAEQWTALRNGSVQHGYLHGVALTKALDGEGLAL